MVTTVVFQRIETFNVQFAGPIKAASKHKRVTTECLETSHKEGGKDIDDQRDYQPAIYIMAEFEIEK